MAKIEIRADGAVFSGDWTVAKLRQIGKVSWPTDERIVIDASGIGKMDTAGALHFKRLQDRLEKSGHQVAVSGLKASHAELVRFVALNIPAGRPLPPQTPALSLIGQTGWNALRNLHAMLAFLGEASLAFLRMNPARLRFLPLLHNVQHAGFDALPICGLLSFLMGIVIAYQGAEQLARYGANIFVVDLVGLSMLRELSPLLTAIIVAGRSGSAFTAQIGTMKVTDEVDALETIGIPPIEQLVLPKIVALLIALPLLTVFADICGVFGGMVMASIELGVGFGDFLQRFESSIRLSALMVGVGKTPVFAAIVAVVGCYQGLRVEGGADSVGRQTTESVVQSIFLVIVADAVFSVIFSMMNI